MIISFISDNLVVTNNPVRSEKYLKNQVFLMKMSKKSLQRSDVFDIMYSEKENKMKEFDKWIIRRQYGNRPRKYSDSQRDMARNGWKAALELIIQNIEDDNIIGTNDGNWPQQQCREEIVKFIERELGV